MEMEGSEEPREINYIPWSSLELYNKQQQHKKQNQNV